MSMKSQNVNSFSARLKPTIKQNENVGINSGVYLTNSPSRNLPVEAPSPRIISRSVSENRDSAKQRPPLARPPQRCRSITMGSIPVGSYRNMLKNDPNTIRSNLSPKAECDPFHEKTSSLHGDNQSSRHSSMTDSCASDDSFNSFGVDEEVDFEKSFACDESSYEAKKKEVKMTRPAKEKRNPSLGNRRVRIILEAEASQKVKSNDCVTDLGRKNVITVTAGQSEPGELGPKVDGNEYHDDEEKNVLTVRYVSNQLGASRQGLKHSMRRRKGSNSLETTTQSLLSASKPRYKNSLDLSSTHSKSKKDSNHERDSTVKRREAVAAKPRFREEGRCSARQLKE